MPNNDISDLHGVYPTTGRWSAENGVFGYGAYDNETGERTVEPIELGSAMAKFVMDLATRERGYGLIRTGLYDMRLTPVNSPPPPWPDDDDFKPAVGFWMWNPPLGEVRVETNGAIFRTAISALWDHCRTFKESSEGLQPVIHFTGRQERLIRAIGKVFWAPTINVIGWVPRDKIPTFAVRPPTVSPPLAIDSQVKHALLEHLRQDQPKREEPKHEEPARPRGKAKSGTRIVGVGHSRSETFGPKPGSIAELLDDKLPDDDLPI